MIIECKSCSRKFIVKDNDIPEDGRVVQCGYCSVTWHQMPASILRKKDEKSEINKIKIIDDESPSVESIKGSDGKTYRFLGSQWAELLPSGKTGLFARKKISKELDQITGRKVKKITKRKQKKNETVDPSESINIEKQLPDIYKPKQNLGVFGYLFLLIVISFSFIGILKTFETDLINYFPEIEYIFDTLNEQLIYISEAVKNMITIFIDLINSY